MYIFSNPYLLRFHEQTLETSEPTMINTALRETGSLGQIHSFKGHMGVIAQIMEYLLSILEALGSIPDINLLS